MKSNDAQCAWVGAYEMYLTYQKKFLDMAMFDIGDHLVTSRGAYTHHGIYIGDGKVIHYSGFADGLSGGPIEITTLSKFRNGSNLYVRRHSSPKYKGSAAVKRAKMRLGENKYDLHANNCEHFCYWVITGESASRQVNFVEAAMDVLVPFAGAGVKIRRELKQISNRKPDKNQVKEVLPNENSAVASVLAPGRLAYRFVKRLLK